MDYEIDIAEDMLGESMLKILLQPLLVYGIFHGFKKTRLGGCFKLTGRLTDGHLVFVVEDNGLGMKQEDLFSLRENLLHYDVSNPDMGFGMYNVFKRVQLYYEIDDGLSVESEYQKGSKMTLRLPVLADSSSQAISSPNEATDYIYSILG